jgi:hypothetical protein
VGVAGTAAAVDAAAGAGTAAVSVGSRLLTLGEASAGLGVVALATNIVDGAALDCRRSAGCSSAWLAALRGGELSVAATDWGMLLSPPAAEDSAAERLAAAAGEGEPGVGEEEAAWASRRASSTETPCFTSEKMRSCSSLLSLGRSIALKTEALLSPTSILVAPLAFTRLGAGRAEEPSGTAGGMRTDPLVSRRAVSGEGCFCAMTGISRSDAKEEFEACAELSREGKRCVGWLGRRSSCGDECAPPSCSCSRVAALVAPFPGSKVAWERDLVDGSREGFFERDGMRGGGADGSAVCCSCTTAAKTASR